MTKFYPAGNFHNLHQVCDVSEFVELFLVNYGNPISVYTVPLVPKIARNGADMRDFVLLCIARKSILNLRGFFKRTRVFYTVN